MGVAEPDVGGGVEIEALAPVCAATWRAQVSDKKSANAERPIMLQRMFANECEEGRQKGIDGDADAVLQKNNLDLHHPPRLPAMLYLPEISKEQQASQ